MKKEEKSIDVDAGCNYNQIKLVKLLDSLTDKEGSIMKETYAVIGAGNGGQAMAAHLTLLGYNVHLYDTDPEKIRELQKTGEIIATGKVEGTAKISLITENLSAAVKGCNVIFIVTTTDQHISVAEKLLPIIEETQMVVLFPGQTGGTIVVRNVFLNGGKHIAVAETQDLIYTCRSEKIGTVSVTALKKSMDMAAFNQEEYERIFASIGGLYPQLRQAKSLLHTGFDNVGAILHPVPSLFNAGRIESGEDFLYYKEGITPAIAAVLEKLDQERIAVAAAYGVEATSVGQWMKNAYSVEGETLYELFQNNKSYAAVKGAKKLEHRFITEDVPCGLVPIAELGKLAGVDTPVMEHVIALAGILLNQDYKATGRNLKALGLEGKAVDEIKELFL